MVFSLIALGILCIKSQSEQYRGVEERNNDGQGLDGGEYR